MSDLASLTADLKSLALDHIEDVLFVRLLAGTYRCFERAHEDPANATHALTRAAELVAERDDPRLEDLAAGLRAVLRDAPRTEKWSSKSWRRSRRLAGEYER